MRLHYASTSSQFVVNSFFLNTVSCMHFNVQHRHFKTSDLFVHPCPTTLQIALWKPICNLICKLHNCSMTELYKRGFMYTTVADLDKPMVTLSTTDSCPRWYGQITGRWINWRISIVVWRFSERKTDICSNLHFCGQKNKRQHTESVWQNTATASQQSSVQQSSTDAVFLCNVCVDFPIFCCSGKILSFNETFNSFFDDYGAGQEACFELLRHLCNKDIVL